MTTPLTLHRVRFAPHDSYCTAPVSSLALHPSAPLLAVARSSGALELWAAPAPVVAARRAAAASSPHAAQAATGAAAAARAAAAAAPALALGGSGPWLLLATVRGATPRLQLLQHLCWAPTSGAAAPPLALEGCRLFGCSLTGSIFEADFGLLRLLPAAESNAGAVWSLAAFDLRRVDGGPGCGSLLALGCEDGSVRLMRMLPAASHHTSALSVSLGPLLELVAVCPGTDGRILCVAWHPARAVLFAGSTGGAIRGWDVSSLAASEVAAHGSALARATAHEVRVRARELARHKATAVGSAAASRLVSGTGDSEDEEDDEDVVGSGGLQAASGSTGPRALVRMQLDPQQQSLRRTESAGAHRAGDGTLSVQEQARHPARARVDRRPPPVSVWSLCVLSDFTVISGDSRGEVLAWDGRMGVLACSAPLLRAGGAVLSVAVVEDAGSSFVTVAAGSLDGLVAVITRASSGVKSPDGPAQPPQPLQLQMQRWVNVGVHRAHVADVRAVAVSGLARGAWAISGAADGRLCIALTRPGGGGGGSGGGGLKPRQISPSWQGGSPLLAICGARDPGHHGASGDGFSSTPPLLACFTGDGTGVQLWGLRCDGADSAAAEGAELLLQVDTPQLSLAAATPPPSSSLPVTLRPTFRGGRGATRKRRKAGDMSTSTLVDDAPRRAPADGAPSALAATADGRWLAYASTGGCVPPVLLHLALVAGDTGRAASAVPTFVPLPESIVTLLRGGAQHSASSRSAAPSTQPPSVSLLHLVSVLAPEPGASGQALLLLVVGLRLCVCLCSQSGVPGPATGVAAGAKRRRGSEAELDAPTPSPTCSLLYWLPVPSAHGDAVTVAASSSASFGYFTQSSSVAAPAAGRLRARSNTIDSMGGASVALSSRSQHAATEDSALRGEDEAEGDQERVADACGRQSSSSSAHAGGASWGGSTVMPLLLASHACTRLAAPAVGPGGGSGSGSGVLAALSTSSRHVHLYWLQLQSGSLRLTLPLSATLPTALAFAAPGADAVVPTLCMALRSGGLAFFDCATGRLQPWSPEPQQLPANLLLRAQWDAVRALVPLSPCPGDGGGGAPFKLLAFGADSAAAITLCVGPRGASSSPPPLAAARKSAASASSVAVTASALVGFHHLRLAGRIGEGVAVVEDPAARERGGEGALSPAPGRRKYGR